MKKKMLYLESLILPKTGAEKSGSSRESYSRGWERSLETVMGSVMALCFVSVFVVCFLGMEPGVSC